MNAQFKKGALELCVLTMLADKDRYGYELTDDEADDQITIVSGHQKSHESTAFNGDADDEELIAVIAAAISASTGLSTDDFVVRSIRRR